jgi:hypothetical protein
MITGMYFIFIKQGIQQKVVNSSGLCEALLKMNIITRGNHPKEKTSYGEENKLSSNRTKDTAVKIIWIKKFWMKISRIMYEVDNCFY